MSTVKKPTATEVAAQIAADLDTTEEALKHLLTTIATVKEGTAT